MTKEDKIELHRLSKMLHEIDAKLESGSVLREGLVKAMFFLELGFSEGYRHDVELLYNAHPSRN
jgi:hypothetical protein